jgi:hypothetical protein
MDELWEKDQIDISLGKRIITFYPSLLKVKKTQTIILREQGISRINTTDIYDYQVSKEYQNMFIQPSLISGYQDFDAKDISWKVFTSNSKNLEFAKQLNG